MSGMMQRAIASILYCGMLVLLINLLRLPKPCPPYEIFKVQKLTYRYQPLLAVYDNDGQEGIFIPKSMEVDAAKEVGANMGSSLNSSINISSNAGAQLASDLGKGVIQGVSQYISKKMRTVKIHLKAGYRVMLYQEED